MVIIVNGVFGVDFTASIDDDGANVSGMFWAVEGGRE
jgi:hypothetical protein